MLWVLQSLQDYQCNPLLSCGHSTRRMVHTILRVPSKYAHVPFTFRQFRFKQPDDF